MEQRASSQINRYSATRKQSATISNVAAKPIIHFREPVILIPSFSRALSKAITGKRRFYQLRKSEPSFPLELIFQD